MRAIRFISTGFLLVLLGIAGPIYAQPQDKEKPQQEKQQPQQQAKPQEHAQQQAKQPQERAQQQPQQQAKQPQEHAQQQAKQPQERAQQQPQQQAKQPQQQAKQQAYRPSEGRRVAQAQEPAVWQQHRANNWQSDHRSWQQRGGYDGYRIPEANFSSHFGRDHGFRIGSDPMMILGGYPSFQYGGFWFSVVDPWPEYWSADWYNTDDVYIDYSNDGYYLYDARYPGVGIAISITVD